MNSRVELHHRRRLRAERRFRAIGRAALGCAVLCLLVLLGSIASRGFEGLMRTELRLSVPLRAELLTLSPDQTVADLSPAAFTPLLFAALRERFPEASEADQRELFKLLSKASGLQIKQTMTQPAEGVAQDHAVLWLPASSLVTAYLRDVQDDTLSDTQRQGLMSMQQTGELQRVVDTGFFTRGDSRSPEQAGFLGAMLGSLYTMVVCLFAAFPLGVMSAVYLEEFAKKTRFAQVIEVNVNNLAAVPSIVYGLLGLSVYINVMHLPRSAPLVGGLTLALMVFPVIIIATRTALASVPPSIRQGALALGASSLQVVWHHSLPLALPGIMTGTILGMARAIGETAPLLMIGMVAFVADLPSGFTQAATVMPVQIYLWAGSPEVAFADKTASGILVLLAWLLVMNALAIYLRRRFEVRW